ncbi:MAG: mandelate racemase/muconate lactonizing enzyme family protein [Desulfobacterales bacterium]|nr:MAG: mandelate racemase/muconate lactonizing enzyme family protein [Desulfobacterales bacterium]
MKIVSVEATPLEAPLAKFVARARQTVPLKARRCLVVKITTDEGLVGYGEGLTPVAPQPAAAVVREVLTPFLIGRDPLDSEPLWEKLYATNKSRGYTRGYQMIAISAVDIALWDLKGKILGQPVYRLLGGTFWDRIPVYATGLMMEGDTAAIVNLAHQYYAQGFRAMKLKIGQNARQEIETVRALRQTFGSDLKIMVDANGAYDPPTAIKIGRRLEELDVYWFEEPVTPEDVIGLTRVREHLNMYIAAGECEYTKFGFRELLLKNAVDICQPDVARAGGITECKKIAALAQAFNLYYAPHAWGGVICIAATLHLAASLPNLLVCEFDRVPNPLRDELPVEPLDFRDGFLHLPDRAGLGVTPNEEIMRRYTLAT